jgi:hypothetical protein
MQGKARVWGKPQEKLCKLLNMEDLNGILWIF